ncbi:MAG: type II toxin-antitoxin system RelE/ParE family toxin [Oscillospiraceae bacterium]|jgi:phage-related protein|nr:type II toxin-antitoxin system RelE/ParE family toxin [Oscillospiraceae bacterium]
MFEVHFYEDKHGRQPIKELLITLRDKSQDNKDARIQYHKILSYIRTLEKYGTRVGEPAVKHIDGDIWELRPLKHRIFFFYWKNNNFILLHHFIKKTNKTPPKEIKQAQRNLDDYKERND